MARSGLERERPASAISMPKITEAMMAVTDRAMVHPRPASRKLRLEAPLSVRGLITYQPQL